MADKDTNETIAANLVRSLLSYDASTGAFRWLSQKGAANSGDAAGSRTAHGYITICLNYQRHYAHRLAWLYVTGKWPRDQIDHINGDGADNRFANLRECTNAENHQNIGLRKDNSSGMTGVRWDRLRGKWSAQIRRDGRITPLGRHETAGQAHAAYLAAKAAAHTFQPIPRELAK
jgi:hypothetical protein